MTLYKFSIRWKGEKDFYPTALFYSMRQAVHKANNVPCEVRIQKIGCSIEQLYGAYPNLRRIKAGFLLR